MLYLVTGTDPTALALVASGAVGYIAQPGSNLPPAAGTWAADNGCVASGPGGMPIPNPKWSADRWLAWLERHVDQADRCLFAVLPDVPLSHEGTVERSMQWAERVRDLGYRPAFAFQNGSEVDPDIPWDAFDVAFLGGDTAWKVGHRGHLIATRAVDRGKWVHMGRVNSERRLRRAAVMGCSSADGTFLRFGPRVNVPRLLRWLDSLAEVPPFDPGLPEAA